MKLNAIHHELVSRYDVPGPRYTSYPTAPHFQPWGNTDWLHALQENERYSHRPLSLYFHLPFCPTLCLYCGCNVIITRDRNRVGRYMEYLIREMELMQTLVPTKRAVKQVHWGGGSPTWLTPYEIHKLAEAIGWNFNLSRGAELSVEVDPRRLTEEHVAAFCDAGFNRIRLGVQDFNPEVQQAVRRLQTEQETINALEWFRKRGVRSVNIDLIYGLPGQTVESFHQTLQRVIELRPERIAAFNFAYLPTMKPHQRAIDATALPGQADKMMIQADIIETLTEAGYRYIGMDHFALPQDELSIAQQQGRLHRNFQGYTTGAECDLLGFGITSISSLDRTYAQNVKTLPEYEAAIDQGQLPTSRGLRLTDDDYLRRHIINELMCNLRLSIPRFEKNFEIDFFHYFPDIEERMAPMVIDGLVRFDPDSIDITERGRLFLRNIAMQFDAYLGTNDVVFSRTV